MTVAMEFDDLLHDHWIVLPVSEHDGKVIFRCSLNIGRQRHIRAAILSGSRVVVQADTDGIGGLSLMRVVSALDSTDIVIQGVEVGLIVVSEPSSYVIREFGTVPLSWWQSMSTSGPANLSAEELLHVEADGSIRYGAE